MILSTNGSVAPYILISDFLQISDFFRTSEFVRPTSGFPCNQSNSKRFKAKISSSPTPLFCALCDLSRLIPIQLRTSAFRFQFTALVVLGRLRGRLGTPFGTGKSSRNPRIHWSGTAGRGKRGGRLPHLFSSHYLNLNRQILFVAAASPPRPRSRPRPRYPI